jgi:hypothetical protein
MRDVQVAPFWNTEMASLSVAPRSSVHRLEKHQMYSRRLSPDCFLQLHSSHCLPGRVYVPWKFLTKTQRRSVQLWILSCGMCSSHVRSESLR